MAEMLITPLCPKKGDLSRAAGSWQFSHARMPRNSKFLAKESFHDVRQVRKIGKNLCMEAGRLTRKNFISSFVFNITYMARCDQFCMQIWRHNFVQSG